MHSIERSALGGEKIASEEYTRDESVSCQEEAAQGRCDDGPAYDIPSLRNASPRTVEIFSLPAAFFAFHILLDRRGQIVQVRGR